MIFFKLKVDTSPEEELEMANITQRYPLLKERLQKIAVNFSILNSLYNFKNWNSYFLPFFLSHSYIACSTVGEI